MNSIPYAVWPRCDSRDAWSPLAWALLRGNVMKKALLSTVALVSLTAGTVAADLPPRAAPPVSMAAVPYFSWTGLYVGLNGGYAFSEEGRRNRLVTPNGT